MSHSEARKRRAARAASVAVSYYFKWFHRNRCEIARPASEARPHFRQQLDEFMGVPFIRKQSKVDGSHSGVGGGGVPLLDHWRVMNSVNCQSNF